jgi:germination protein M
MRKRYLVLLVIGLLAAVAVTAGCGGSSSPVLTSPASMPQTTPTPTTSGVSIFLLKGETVTQVERPTGQGSVSEALNALLSGPTEGEKTQGFSTAIPAGTQLQHYTVSDGTATVDFSKEMLNYGGGSARVQAIINQITNTVITNDKAIKTVAITVDGKPADEVLQP